MENVTYNCPNCGAPVTLGENVLVAVCDYCRSPIQRVEPGSQAAAQLGMAALRTGNFEEADLHFTQALHLQPQENTVWLYRAVAAALIPYRSSSEAISYLQASGYDHAAAVSCLGELTSQSMVLLEKCLERGSEITGAPALADLLVDGAFASTNPDHRPRLARAYKEFAERAWIHGQPDRAVDLMVNALKIDPAQHPTNLWLLDLARKKLA
jgi:hypothetical protein